MYHVLTKKQKKELKDKYRISKRGQSMLPRLNRLVAEGLFLLVFPLVLLIIGFITRETPWWYWTLTLGCFFAGFVFLIGQHVIRTNEYENFLKFQNDLKKKLTKR